MAEFKSKLGLIAATVGSAVGLGNVWRFPAETQANGGAAFLVLYCVCVVVLGIPVMLAEFSLGRASRADAVGSFRELRPGTHWRIIGGVAVVAAYMISCFYMVVEGWTLEYLWASVSGDLYAQAAPGVDAGGDLQFSMMMDRYINHPFWPIVAVVACVALNVAILLEGVQRGIERLSNVMMPTFFVVLVGLCAVSLTLPGAGDGLRWFLTPDFGAITPSTVINALGQTFFSLSLGMGILVTYASYYPASTTLTRTATIVAGASLAVAVLMGCIIFPAVMTFGLEEHSLRGATLVFQTLPEVFVRLPATRVCSGLFFLLLAVAALTSTVSILEVTIAFVQQRLGLGRRAAVLWTVLPLTVLSSVCALSFGPMDHWLVSGLTVFDFLDQVSTNWLLPVVAVGNCVFIGWCVPRGILRSQLTNDGSLRGPLEPVIRQMIRLVAPPLIAIIFISNFL